MTDEIVIVNSSGYLDKDYATKRFENNATKLEQQVGYGYDPNLDSLIGTHINGTPVRLYNLPSMKDRGLDLGAAVPRTPDLWIAGSTESQEELIQRLKGSGVVVARYSIFYGEPSGYTGRTPTEGGYALDVPKSVSTVRALLHDEQALRALQARDESRILEALASLNKSLPAPILATDYLSEALRTA